MANLVGALMPLTGDNVTFGNDYRQLACGPLFAAGHVNAANDSVVPSLKSLVSGSQVPAHRSKAAPYNYLTLTLTPCINLTLSLPGSVLILPLSSSLSLIYLIPIYP